MSVGAESSSGTQDTLPSSAATAGFPPWSPHLADHVYILHHSYRIDTRGQTELKEHGQGQHGA